MTYRALATHMKDVHDITVNPTTIFAFLSKRMNKPTVEMPPTIEPTSTKSVPMPIKDKVDAWDFLKMDGKTLNIHPPDKDKSQE